MLILNSVFKLFGKFIATLCDASGGFSDSVGNEMQHTMKEGNETDIFVQFTRCSPPTAHSAVYNSPLPYFDGCM